ncbi:hypothetical protein SEMRO_160_G072320.1 [Seminavis robusta]|uniref:Uncharacterized protein n=1 Tax=Seminavis robusta TaxID=568900 RepID=A0A9N8DME1_9STRA|nr:hypothetical protein SEMRO_160_G072320.1 [Seminavis robusta]|eukprot:Sro160_g072320.1 n/a (115) ;mRNA; r:102987-103331
MQGSSPNNVAGPVGQETQTALVAIHKVMTMVAQEILIAPIHVLEEVEACGNPEPEGRYFRAKADATAYPTLRSNKEFDTWYEAFIVIARAQGFYKVFDTEYVPMTAEYFAELLR